MLAFLKRFATVPKAPLRLIASWFFCCTVFELFRTDTILSVGATLLVFLGTFLTLTTAQLFLPWPRLSGVALVVCTVTYAIIQVYVQAAYGNNWFLLLLLLFAVAVILFPLLHRETGRLLPFTVSRRWCIAAVIVAGLICCGVNATITCLRYLTFSSPNYDFGIWCNMFHHMSQSLTPLVSCERDQLLSHFAVHVSPIYYLILPFYALFPSPLTLQIAQAVVLASGLIPLYRLARHFRLSPTATAVVCAIYAAYPPLTTGCFYDLHENCFLTPLLLWLFALYEEKHYAWMTVVACLVLAVKEDAAVYLAFFALYLLFSKRDCKRGIPLAAGAIVYFGIVVFLLMHFGDGAMFGRYEELLSTERDTGGLLGTLLRDPANFLQIIATQSTTSDKLRWLLTLLLPLGALLWTPRGHYSRLWLLAPLLLNLLTNYTYMFDVGFQYQFGITAFLFYLLVQNTADAPALFRRNQLLFALIATVLTYTMLVLSSFSYYVNAYVENYDTYTRLEELLDTVPDNASVTTDAMLLPHLADRDCIYEAYYHPIPDTDYVVLDMRHGLSYDEYIGTALDYGYTEALHEEGLLLILQSPNIS